MSEYNAYPLSWPVGWPRTKVRVYSRFYDRSNTLPSIAKGAKTILEELRRLGVYENDVVISTNIELRLDGLPRSNRTPASDSGAAVYFKIDLKQKVLACDKYVTVGENLYAIGKTIEATRAIERWGSVTTEQAFAGYVQLEEKTGPSCWDVLGIPPLQGSHNGAGENAIMDAYRRKAKETHPDKPGGSEQAFDRVVRAKDIALQLIK